MQDPIGANPYAAPAARVEQPVSASSGERSSRAARLGAAVLDNTLLLGPVFLAWFFNGMMVTDAIVGILGAAAVVSAVVLVIDVVLLHRHGQTLGKRWIGIRIVRVDGSRAGLGRTFLLRMLLPGVIGLLPVAGQLFLLVDALAIFGEGRRCLHDHFADTIVVDA
ncbi:hypothetical protein LYSHEL_11710 [Lysobacter helvus]|uniref:RDD domain-containing protein n=2 Tax=Lysobacteraceae TaxID=32033 RepID=A0ABN6FVX3_9GAMM|nr:MULTISPECIES: RDD family protein [Lysobacter]BCT92147.1 hypothetical protein LYSCAS_11710 [Lysobacter caseinilyticus]BCT95300.1 hypothetical protein LYSHEL_11710 [Lysobacter helvus]